MRAARPTLASGSYDRDRPSSSSPAPAYAVTSSSCNSAQIPPEESHCFAPFRALSHRFAPEIFLRAFNQPWLAGSKRPLPSATQNRTFPNEWVGGSKSEPWPSTTYNHHFRTIVRFYLRLRPTHPKAPLGFKSSRAAAAGIPGTVTYSHVRSCTDTPFCESPSTSPHCSQPAMAHPDQVLFF